MKLIKCYISSFGKLKDFTIDFNTNLNVIYQKNGFGKSTLASFVKCMFYGVVDGKKSLLLNERKKYIPWGSNSTFGGYIIFETKGVQYKIERFFGSKASEDSLLLYNIETGKTIDIDDDFAQKLFGVDQEGFLSTLFFSESDLDVKSNSSLTAKYNSTIDIDTQDDSDKAINSIKNLAKTYMYSGERGLIYDCMRDISSVECQLSDIDTASKQLEDLTARAKKLEEQLNGLQTNNQLISSKIEYLGNVKANLLKKEQIIQIKNDCAKLEEDLNKYNNILNGIDLEQSQISKIKNIIDELNIVKAQIKSTEDDIKEFNDKKALQTPKNNNGVPFFVATFGFLLAIASIFILSFSKTTMGYIVSAFTFVIGATLIAFWIYIIKKQSNNSNFIDDAINQKRQKLSQYTSLSQDYSDSLNRFLSSFNIAYSNFEEAVVVLENALFEKNRLTNMISELNLKIKSINLDYNFNETQDALEDIETLTIQLAEGNNQYREKAGLLAQYKSDIIFLENKLEQQSILESKLFELKERLVKLKDELNVLSLAQKYLQKADQNLKIRYKEPINKSFQKYLSYLTKNAKIGDIDVDFQIGIEEQGSQKSIDYYSKGYKVLFNICRRFALIDVLYAQNKPFIILDDPFLSLDGDNLELALNLVKELSKEFQIIYFVCHESRSIEDV